MIRLVLILAVIGAAGTYLILFLDRRRRERVAQLRSAFLVSRPEPREQAPALKEVQLRNGTLRFRVPQSWAEEYPDPDSAAFRAQGGGRVLRVATATIPCPPGGLGDALRARAEEPTALETLASGDLLLKSLTVDRGNEGEVVRYRWIVGRPIPDARARIATFTLVVPLSSAGDVFTRDEVALVERQVRAAEISYPRA
jgi:hypothetical protein